MRVDRPGYQRRINKDGTVVHYWNPHRAVKAAPAYLHILRLPAELSDSEVASLCRQKTSELQTELAGLGAAPQYDGTIKSLITVYRFDKTSSLHTVKHSTRIRDYEPSLRVLEKTVGTRRIDALKRSDFIRWFSEWKKKGHRRASGAMKLLRLVISYGAGERLHGCAQARGILADIRFEQPPSRDVAMTYAHCLAIVRTSAELGCPSIGFVEALKFETALRRIDVIGEWSPAEDGGPFHWRGLTMGDIKGMVLKLKTSKTGAAVVRDLSVLPLVTEALKAYDLPEFGPVVIDEDHGKPYWENRYTAKFRKVRDAAGVPHHVWSMDSRAGAVSETVEATGSLEDAQKIATHASSRMTARYNRGDGLEMSRKIASARASMRQ